MSRIMYIMLALVLAATTACGAQAPAATATTTQVPATITPSLTPSPPPAPTSTPTPFPAEDLLVGWDLETCEPQQVFLGQQVVLTTSAGHLFPKEKDTNYFRKNSVVTVKIDQTTPIVMNDPEMWSTPVPSSEVLGVDLGEYGLSPDTLGYMTAMSWPLPSLTAGKHHIEVTIDSLFFGTDKGCTELTVMEP